VIIALEARVGVLLVEEAFSAEWADLDGVAVADAGMELKTGVLGEAGEVLVVAEDLAEGVVENWGRSWIDLEVCHGVADVGSHCVHVFGRQCEVRTVWR
jgi:hypothetical protein